MHTNKRKDAGWIGSYAKPDGSGLTSRLHPLPPPTRDGQFRSGRAHGSLILDALYHASQGAKYTTKEPFPLPGQRGSLLCPSCSTWRRQLTTRARSIENTVTPRRGVHALHNTRSTSQRSFTTSPTITAGKYVPPQFKELYNALSEVKDAAIEQVSLSRLSLALRGLESEEPLVRVAVLGLDNAEAARKLVRLLLADPLGPREAWEDTLESYESDPSRGLLIRYGETSDSIPNDLLPTITIRSPLLKKGNIELLVSSIGSDPKASGVTLSAESFLVPNVAIPTSHSGRQNFVRYPVHYSIICGTGVDGLLGFSGLMGRSNLENEVASVRGAISLSGAGQTQNKSGVSFVDLDRATAALDRIRESVQNASEYERGWNGSGVQPVIDWLSTVSRKERETALSPALAPLIESLLNAAEKGVTVREAEALREQAEGTVPAEVRSQLENEVSVWAEQAHSELRSSLEAGFASPRWRGLAWWKLFWRVDDVSMITSEILDKRFLRRAEREVIWTWSTDVGSLAHSNLRYAQQAALRQSPLCRLWRRGLVFFSVSTTTLTSALSALTYAAVPSASVYESCTLAAVGLIYSLRRQQKKWDVARDFWEEEVRDEGRTALLETEAQLRKIVREGGKRLEVSSDRRMRELIAHTRARPLKRFGHEFRHHVQPYPHQSRKVMYLMVKTALGIPQMVKVRDEVCRIKNTADTFSRNATRQLPNRVGAPQIWIQSKMAGGPSTSIAAKRQNTMQTGAKWECGERVHFDSRWTEEEFGEGETDRLAGDSGALDEDSDGVEVDFAVGRDEDTEADDQDGEEDGEVDALEAEKVADEKHDDGADGLEGGKWG
ncbi:hypothetical protein POX_a00136 [Penicillium oxalicum]|uniref:hypothetical protein n=1 Tax=Penicillium oxalicum TaxID=69781 RepID=UPI0020B8E858|nr:hypothetical protein POX_a00136 [Penicillium oxalicum]KAI2793555.1 hypothetical protein POX_a00136 [Penicillium oxalicum]